MHEPEPEPDPAPFRDGFGRRVRAAVLEVLGDERFDGLTVEDLAAELDVRPSQLYARWASKPELMATAVSDRMAEIPVPDTGDLREDLLGFTAEWLSLQSGDLLPLHRSVIRRIHRSPDMVLAYGIVTRYVEDVVGRIIGRAVARGELPEGTSSGLAEELLRARCWYRLVRGEPLGAQDAQETVDGAILPVLRHLARRATAATG